MAFIKEKIKNNITKNNNSLFMPAMALIFLIIPLASNLLDVRLLFLIFIVAAIIARHFLGKQEFTPLCKEVVFYAASLILTFYFVDTAVSKGMFPLFDTLSDKQGFTGMLALWVILEVVFRYTYAEDNKMDIVNITAGIVAELVLAVNGQWGAQFLMFVVIAGAAAKIMPFAERMKRVLQLFFGAAFIMCNMSLLFQYTEWLHVDNVTYSLETSVVCELILSILALCAMKEWEKIPEDVDIEKVRLCRLQRRSKRLLLLAIALVAVMGLIGYDMGIGSKGTKIAFLGANGEAVEAGIFTNTFVSLLYQIYGAWQTALSRNIFGTGYAFLGVIGAGLAVMLIGICAWLLYRGHQQGFEGKEQSAAMALLELLVLLVTPVAWELLPLYELFLYDALWEYVPTKEEVKLFWMEKRQALMQK